MKRNQVEIKNELKRNCKCKYESGSFSMNRYSERIICVRILWLFAKHLMLNACAVAAITQLKASNNKTNGTLAQNVAK